MSLAGASKLQLSKSIRRGFRGVLGAVPVVNDGGAEIVAQGHRSVGISRTPTLAEAAIAVRGDTEKKTMAIFCCINSESCQRGTFSEYLKESSTKVVQILFLMILGIQLCKYFNRLRDLM